MTAAERESLWHELNYQQAIRADAGLPPLDLIREFDLAAGRVAVNRYRQALAQYVNSALRTVPFSPGMVTTFQRYRTAHRMAVRALSVTTGLIPLGK
jgi:hypothetical protein